MIAATVRVRVITEIVMVGVEVMVGVSVSVRVSVSVSIRVVAPQEQVAHHRIYGMTRHRILRSTFGVLDVANVAEHDIGRIRVREYKDHIINKGQDQGQDSG